MCGKWEADLINQLNPSIKYLELYTLTLAIVKWAKFLTSKRVIMYCDNQAVVQMVNHNTSGCINCMYLIRIIVMTSLKYNVRFFCQYINTKANVLADALCRNDLTRFWRNAPKYTKRIPNNIPSELSSVFAIWKWKKGDKLGVKPINKNSYFDL